ncbi:NAD(P)H-binding protein [[Flexibacter] sp. ATCC 35208]|uniref:NAD(P)H-binding protein n=1 Tax=[Flexibacter] sp. ATCC 35208 TaxID=1936242 RepID=UPI0009C8D430|nr:NAD(P)H-binding protein [[Flexibacter] sp. ATCC 35208]OMP76367.1 NAD-dependent dehydratase [[Flexibacter] sp. ATCC 35208]
MHIVITGSLGNIGKPLTQDLLQQGHRVTVISTNPEKQQDIAALGAKAAIGKLEDVDFLTKTLEGADALFAMEPPNFGAPDHIEYYSTIARSYVAAVKAAGVKRIVHLSSWGAHLEKGTGFITGSYHAEQIINTLNEVAVTHLRPGSFFTNLYSFVGMIKHAGFIGSNYGGDDKVVMVHPRDIATVAAEELVKKESDLVRYVARVDITASAAAKAIGAAIGKPDLQWVTLSDEQVTKALLERGMQPFQVTPLVELGAAIHSGAMRSDYDLHPPKEMGRTTIEEFAKEFSAAF